MRICPECRTTYPAPQADVCMRDGKALVDHARFVDAERDPLRGKVIGGRYEIGECIGQGGMGTVYRGEQAGLNRPVALKILKRELNVDPETVARFHREANAMSKLTHGNTVRVYDFGQTDDGLLYLVMELLEGELITQKMDHEGELDLLEALRYTQQMLRSLAEAHSQGIVHRDLKPDNIFLARVDGHGEPMVKVLDFGIAKVVAPGHHALDQFETQAGTVFGTPRYMSPEQAQGVVLDPRSDLYSVGTLLYQMITGVPPFVDDDAVVVMAKHIRERPAPPSAVATHRVIPVCLEAVIMKALAKDPAARFPDATAFDRALEQCVDEVLLAAGLPPRLPGQARWSHALLYGCAGALLVAGVAYGTVRSQGAAPPPVRARAKTAPMLEASVETLNASVTASAVVTPARIALHSRPTQAQVWRDGEVIGTTPLDLWVKPELEFMRVELRKEGYQPMVAEVTATEGERMLTLVPTPPSIRPAKRPIRRRRPRAAKRKVAPVPVPKAAPAVPAPAPKPTPARPTGPYERFD